MDISLPFKSCPLSLGQVKAWGHSILAAWTPPHMWGPLRKLLEHSSNPPEKSGTFPKP